MRKSLMVLAAILITLPLLFDTLSRKGVLPAVPQAPIAVSDSTHGSLAPAVIVQFGGTLGLEYSPANVFIHPGETVEWQGDFTSHPLVSDEGLWTMVSTGTDFSFTFNTPGVYHFHCFYHVSLGMKGTVTVGYRALLPLID